MNSAAWLSISYYDCHDHSEKKLFITADRVTLGHRAEFSDAPPGPVVGSAGCCYAVP